MATLNADDIRAIIAKLYSDNKRDPAAELKFLLSFLRKSINRPITPEALQMLEDEIARLKKEIKEENLKITNLAKRMPLMKKELSAAASTCDWISLDRFIANMISILSTLGVQCSAVAVKKMNFTQRLDYAIELLDVLTESLVGKLDALDVSK